VEECGPCPVYASFTLAFALQLRKKHGKTSVRVRKTSLRLRKTSEYSIHITKTPTHYKTLTNTHITKPIHTHTHTHTHIQNNKKLPQYKLKQNAHRKSNTMGRKNSIQFVMLLIHRCSN
jgi:hypothetical protein